MPRFKLIVINQMPETISQCLDRLRRQIDTTLPISPPTAAPGLYSMTTELYLDQIPVVPQLESPFLIWGRPDHNHYRIGCGAALLIETGGRGRFEKLQQQFEEVVARWQHDCLTEQPYQPGAFCAFAFDEDDQMGGPWQGIANSLIFIPEVLLEFSEGRYTLSLCCQQSQLKERQARIERWLDQAAKLLAALMATDAGGDRVTLYRPPGEQAGAEWMARVEAATRAIRDNRFTKVVPARHLPIRACRPFNPAAVLKRLAKCYPSCLLLGFSVGDKTVIAATPERLVALNNGTISCDALGGTGRRSGDPKEDNLLAHRLLQDMKTRHEHQLVVEHLRHHLGQVSAHLSIPDTPSVLPLGQLQHLWTPIKAQCRPGISLFDLAALIHPTPAVAGTPTAEARQWLKAHEPFQRGWYCGGVGWIQADGNGELAVLLRTALLAGSHADLYAGAGVVANSDPRAELDETELKLAAVIDALSDQPAADGALQTVRQ